MAARPKSMRRRPLTTQSGCHYKGVSGPGTGDQREAVIVRINGRRAHNVPSVLTHGRYRVLLRKGRFGSEFVELLVVGIGARRGVGIMNMRTDGCALCVQPRQCLPGRRAGGDDEPLRRGLGEGAVIRMLCGHGTAVARRKIPRTFAPLARQREQAEDLSRFR